MEGEMNMLLCLYNLLSLVSVLRIQVLFLNRYSLSHELSHHFTLHCNELRVWTCLATRTQASFLYKSIFWMTADPSSPPGSALFSSCWCKHVRRTFNSASDHAPWFSPEGQEVTKHKTRLGQYSQTSVVCISFNVYLPCVYQFMYCPSSWLPFRKLALRYSPQFWQKVINI